MNNDNLRNYFSKEENWTPKYKFVFRTALIGGVILGFLASLGAWMIAFFYLFDLIGQLP